MKRYILETIGTVKGAFDFEEIAGLKSAIRTFTKVQEVELIGIGAGEYQIDVKTSHDYVLLQNQVNEIAFLVRGYLYRTNPAIVFVQADN